MRITEKKLRKIIKKIILESNSIPGEKISLSKLRSIFNKIYQEQNPKAIFEEDSVFKMSDFGLHVSPAYVNLFLQKYNASVIDLQGEEHEQITFGNIRDVEYILFDNHNYKCYFGNNDEIVIMS